jgi:hypothetical protein
MGIRLCLGARECFVWPVPTAQNIRCIILIPTYNTGPKVTKVVQEVLDAGYPVIAVADGSTDGTTPLLEGMRDKYRGLIVLSHFQNQGKGQAVLTGARHALAAGFTHILAYDADGQHPVASIPAYLEAAGRSPRAMVAGYPVFDREAPWERVFFRKLATFWTRLIGLNHTLRDSMFGMRIYPLAALLEALEPTRLGRRYDIECVAAIKLSWAGCPILNIPTPVKYFQADEGGVSHYHYLRDNVRLGLVFISLMPGALACMVRRMLHRSHASAP